VSRSCALALALKDRGPVIAIVEQDGDPGQRRFAHQGVAWLAADEIAGRTFAGVVLDDYDLDDGEVAAWRGRVSGPIVQIDDFLTPLAGIDLIVNARPGLRGVSVGGVAALLGEQFSMLGAPYCNRPPFAVSETVGRVVVGIGLFDAVGATEWILPVVAEVFGRDCWIDILLGSSSPNVSAVAAFANGNASWRLHLDDASPWRLIEGADVAITGGGQSLLERLAIGVPTVGLAVADNQQQPLQCVAHAKAAISLGPVHGDWTARLRAALTTLRDPAVRRQLSAAAQHLIDGRGAARVAKFLHEFPASLRQCCESRQ
jgi:spore coat polysaccharide biosynthesis predicted glycosyltransferase SpsG